MSNLPRLLGGFGCQGCFWEDFHYQRMAKWLLARCSYPTKMVSLSKIQMRLQPKGTYSQTHRADFFGKKSHSPFSQQRPGQKRCNFEESLFNAPLCSLHLFYLGAGTLCLPLFIKRGGKYYGTNFYSGTTRNVSVHHRKVLAGQMKQPQPYALGCTGFTESSYIFQDLGSCLSRGGRQAVLAVEEPKPNSS